MKNKSQQLETCKSNNIIIIISKNLSSNISRVVILFATFHSATIGKKILKLLRKKNLWKTQPEMISCVLMFYFIVKKNKKKLVNLLFDPFICLFTHQLRD